MVSYNIKAYQQVDQNGSSVGGDKNGDIKNGIHGFFAAGQAMGGLFGANRLGSTSLTELAVFGNRSGIAASKLASLSTHKIKDESFFPLIEKVKKSFGQKGDVSASGLKVKLQKESWANIGPVRSLIGLQKMDKIIKMSSTIHCIKYLLLIQPTAKMDIFEY